MKLLPNTLEGLVWGLSNFDGIEFDIRLTKDHNLVIYHDAILPNGVSIKKLKSDQLEEIGIPLLSKFIRLKNVVELSKNRRMYIEVKPDCLKNTAIFDNNDKMFETFQGIISNSNINIESIRIISFVKDMLDPFALSYPSYPIIPFINECSNSFRVLKALPKFFARSLTWHMEEAVERKFKGILFARQYLLGWGRFWHPSYSKLIHYANELNLELGTNLGVENLEPDYPFILRFSDKLSKYPRFAKKGESDIIAHRGTGTKGIEIPKENIPELSFQ